MFEANDADPSQAVASRNIQAVGHFFVDLKEEMPLIAIDALCSRWGASPHCRRKRKT
jgi:hypothetical protein